MPRFFSFLFLVFFFWIGGLASSHAQNVLKHQALVIIYAPVWIQEIGAYPLYDIITRIDFDGNDSSSDNMVRSKQFPLPAYVYGEVVAETSDSYYLLYAVYHVRDYDTPLREFFFKSASHDNDFEGTMFVVSKDTGEILAMETWFHSRFLQYAPFPHIIGDQTLDGKIHLEDKTHPIIYVSSKGHGVRGFQKIDEVRLNEGPHHLYRLGDGTPDVKSTKSEFISYRLLSLNAFIKYAKGPFHEKSLLISPQNFGLKNKKIGKYIAGPFQGDSSWARPKPPWSWADKFDTLRPGAWFFHPAYVFNRHFSLNISQIYLYNLAADRIFKVSYAELDTWVQKPYITFFNDIPQGIFYRPMKEVKDLLYRLTEWAFFNFG